MLADKRERIVGHVPFKLAICENCCRHASIDHDQTPARIPVGNDAVALAASLAASNCDLNQGRLANACLEPPLSTVDWGS